MTDYQREYIYCSALLDVRSLDAALALPNNPLVAMRDPSESPEEALIKSQDRDLLHAWLARLKPPLAKVALLLMEGANQAAIAKALHVSEAAISKRITKIRTQAARALGDLRNSALLT